MSQDYRTTAIRHGQTGWDLRIKVSINCAQCLPIPAAVRRWIHKRMIWVMCPCFRGMRMPQMECTSCDWCPLFHSNIDANIVAAETRATHTENKATKGSCHRWKRVKNRCKIYTYCTLFAGTNARNFHESQQAQLPSLCMQTCSSSAHSSFIFLVRPLRHSATLQR